MKTKILTLVSGVLLLWGMTACQSPEEFHPNVDRKDINTFTASFPDDNRDENLFTAEIDYQNRVINVVFPYNYPRLSDNVLKMSALTKMRVSATLDNNVSISPGLFFMDLTKENVITVTNQNGQQHDYKVVAEIRKSAECALTKFRLKGTGLSGVINEGGKTISLVTDETLGEQLAEVEYSHGATISPDPSKLSLNYDSEVRLTVTAQNGTTFATYTVKKEFPQKVAAGLRVSSAKLLWAKKLTELGITSKDMVTGIAAIDNYLVLNERNKAQALYLDGKTGAQAGTIDISAFAGNLTNFYATADDENNILFTNLTPASGNKLTIWRVKGVNGTPEKYIEFTTTFELGRKLSVQGRLDKDAIITAPCYGTAGQFARWQVTGGALVSATPTIVTAKGLGSWGTNADVIYTDPSDVESDYFASYYAEPRNLCRFDGKTNNIKAKGPDINANWVPNAVDFVTFNKVGYVLSNSVNVWTWGVNDKIYMFDTGAGTMDKTVLDFGDSGLKINGNYGAKAAGGQNGNGTADVAFKVSADGYYLYIYFMFTNGYVGCVRCDCLDI